MQPPHPDYVAELEYHHEMYPDELDKPVSLKDQLVSVVSKGRDILGGIKDARDELYGFNGKQGLGVHLKPVEDMKFLPDFKNGDVDSGDRTRPNKGGCAKEPRKEVVVIKEIHHHHHAKPKRGTTTVVVKKEKKEEGDFSDPMYIPPELKKLF